MFSVRSALLLLAAVAFPAAAAPTHYVVAFNQPNGLPANVDKLIADAGGTIVTRLPQIGGVGVVSDNTNFIANVKANNQVKAADTATGISLNPTWVHPDNEVRADSATDNGGNFSPAGADPQPMPDALGSQQWDKMRMNVSLTGSYA